MSVWVGLGVWVWVVGRVVVVVGVGVGLVGWVGWLGWGEKLKVEVDSTSFQPAQGWVFVTYVWCNL